MRRPPLHERRAFRVVVYLLCAIAIAVSIRRLVALAGPPAGGSSPFAALDASFSAKPRLTAGHVLAGLLLAIALPVQLSSTIRNRHRRLHRWLGRVLLVVGGLVGVSSYAMVAAPGEWMLRACGIALGVATTRPIMGIFFATSAVTHLAPPQFFGAAMWIGFTATAAAAELYVRSTRPPEMKPHPAVFRPDARVQGDPA